MSRDASALRALAAAPDLDALEGIRGADPLVAEAWLVAASRQPTPDDGARLLAQAERFAPDRPALELTRLGLLAEAGRGNEVIPAAEALLATGPPDAAAAVARWFVADAHLAAQRLDAAGAAAEHLAATPHVPPETVSRLFAHLALAHEAAGDADAADAWIDRSLSWGGAWIVATHERVGLDPTWRAPATTLFDRARSARPDHPDLLIFAAFEHLERGALEEAEALGTAVEDPRGTHRDDLAILDVRLDLARGDVDAAVASVLARLDARPDDVAFLGLLIGIRERHGAPDDATFATRLRVAHQRLPPGPHRARVAELLAAFGDG